jgi:hypothetical protein
MNRRTTLSAIIASLLLMVATARVATSYNSRKILDADLKANASFLQTTTLASLTDRSQSLPFILSSRDEPVYDCQKFGVCPN